MLAGSAETELGWPNQKELFTPSSPVRRVLAHTVQARIGDPLRRAGADVKAGVLPADPFTEKTDAPLALVCEFNSTPTTEQLNLAHKLAWNFCRSRLLITLERQRIRAWSCCLPPDSDDRIVFDDDASSHHAEASVSDTALHALHWISLASGDFFRKRKPAFGSDGRADAWLLRNLRDVRTELLKSGLQKEICHDLLARLIFVQFLFHRKDSNGVPFIDDNLLRSRFKGQLSQEYERFDQILRRPDDTYAMFRWAQRKIQRRPVSRQGRDA